MFDLLVNAEGGLTTAGYVVCAIAGITLFVLAILFAGRNSEKKKMGTRQLVFLCNGHSLAYVTSYLKLFSLPWGGSVTLCSMLFIVLIGNWYGVQTGIFAVWHMGSCSFCRSLMYFHFSMVCC